MNKYILYTSCLMLSWGMGLSTPCNAQNKRNAKRAKTTKAALIVNINTTIVDEDNRPIKDAEIIASEGAITHYTDKEGKVSIQSRANGIILVEALGYEDIIVDLAKEQFPKILKMKKTEMLASGKYKIERPDGGVTYQKNLVGAIGSTTGEDLSTYPDFSLSNTLQGRVPGLVVRSNVNGLGNNTATLYVRGLHGYTNNDAIVIVDGIERSMDDIIPEEVETIDVLKDATAKILYGARAANGVLVVTTRRGEANKRVIRASVEAGVMLTTRLPKFLNSYDYATLYNEARRNDGMPDFYSSDQLNGYKNSSGVNDLLYPNVDYYDYFLQKQSMYRKAMVDLNGGNNKVRYSMIVNYVGGNGFEKIGDRPDLNRLNVRGNLDIKITDYLSVVADAAARLELRDWSSVDGSTTFSNLSTLRPNEYPLTISSDALGLEPDAKGVPFFGASIRQPENLFANMEYGGFTSERYVTSQTNIGLDFTLDKFVKGLRASAFMTFDNYNYFRQGQVNVYPTYAINMINGEPEFRQMKQLNLQDDQSRLGEETRRTLGWRANVGYSNRFGKHDVAAMLAYHYYQDEVKGDAQDVKNTNTTLRLNYGFDNKYVFEGDLALMGSNRFEKGNRYFLSGAIGAGWILSNEAFLIDCDAINFLKVKASMGILGYDRSTDFLLYKTAWQNGDNLSLGEQNKSTYHTTQLLRLGNKNLKWERSTEWNIGVEGFFLRNRLKAEINYFNELRDNIIGIQGSAYADVLGNFVSYHNIGKVRNNGIDAYVQWNDRNGDFSYQVGVNITWSKNKLLKWDEVNFPDSYLKTVGKPTDVMMGYQALGLFGKDVSLGRNIPQLLGNYQDGDIAYVDLNNDGVVDARDKKMLGNSYPRTVLGIDANLQYKNWGLYILGTAELGLNVWKNNAYYQNKGEGKYSVLALDRWHPENNPNGTYPRLTTTEGENNFVNSSFWLGNGSYFRLKNVELSYTINNKKENALAKKIKIFGRGTNLFSLSKEKDLDPELINAGINNYPVYRTLTGGVTVTF